MIAEVVSAVVSVVEFNAMQPGAHLDVARSALATGQVEEALRHTQAITKGPLAPQARTMEAEIAAVRKTAADERNAASLAASAASMAASLAQERIREVARNLQSELMNRGYDLTVTQSARPNEINIVSNEFSDTDHRVRFLSLLRGHDNLATQACMAGFLNVRLKDREWFAGFSEVYSLDCFR